MAISFNQIPSNIRVPGTYVEIDATRANANQQLESRILVIGQRLSTGTVAAGVPTLITSYPQAVAAFGQGSMLANMFETLFNNNIYTEKWCVALSDNGSGTAAAGLIDFEGSTAATEAGTISLYLGGVLVEVAVAVGDEDTDLATATAAAINANLDLPVTAAVVDDADDNSVSVTYRHKGLVGNKYDIRLNYRGELAGEKLPAGVVCALTQLTGGTADPDISTALSALPSEIFNYWLIPYVSSGVLDDLDTELDSRWHPLTMLDGFVFTAEKGSVSTLSTLGNSRNSRYMSIVDAGNNSPTPPYLWAAAVCGQVAYYASIDPARPFGTLPLVGILAPPPANRRTLTERNTLLYDGIATTFVTKSGRVQIERLVTTYQLNAFDVPDAAYLDANTLFGVSYQRQSLRARITSKFPRHKLADDGNNFGTGQAVLTPKLLKAEIVALAIEWVELALIEDMAQFKRDLIVERNLNDRNRLDAVLFPNQVNQFMVLAGQVAFIL